MSQKTYITTAIPYVNGAPHIGHAEDYLWLIFLLAIKPCKVRKFAFRPAPTSMVIRLKRRPKALISTLSNMLTRIHRSSVTFSPNSISATLILFVQPSEDHIKRVQTIWQRLEKHIYSASYNGWYCEGCERFVTQKEYDEKSGFMPRSSDTISAPHRI